ncbi:hypothetical protein Pyn_28780 [Prunus yedoensis var. nudiflora]|uniref:Uncharacterized protein n=1 Tax=Prunus yedoensis var. nudiflora TaxID=2094558 RepID=A0A314Z7R3_PRUYE|nr:hypothetical protein Pyn_28780 [Prunus yedoensis var. nudiflora]
MAKKMVGTELLEQWRHPRDASQCPSELSSRAEGFISLKAVEGVTTALLLHVQGLMIHSHGFASD